MEDCEESIMKCEEVKLTSNISKDRIGADSAGYLLIGKSWVTIDEGTAGGLYDEKMEVDFGGRNYGTCLCRMRDAGDGKH